MTRNLLLLLLLGITLSVALVKAQRSELNYVDDDDIEEGGDEDDEDEEAEEEVVDVEAEERRQRQKIDPCKKKKCYRGEVCVVNGQVAECQCLSRCEEEPDTRYHVCSTKNQTFQSECFLDRDHCLCKHQLPGCTNRRLRKIQLDYYGECKELTKCPDDEFAEFPIRMNEWLFIVMKQLASRDELGEYIKLLDKAKDDANHTEAILWKFCDLDTSPQDRQVSRRELQYIVQSLKAWEHCLVPFLAKCDKDSNRKISLREWASCLGIDHKKIADKCIDIRARARRQ